VNIQESAFWWTVVAICALPQLARIAFPPLSDYPGFEEVQLFALSSIFTVAVCASVIKSPPLGQSDTLWRTGGKDSSGEGRGPVIAPYGTYYRSQKRAAAAFSLAIWIALVLMSILDSLDSKLFFFLLPISLCGPGLYLRDGAKNSGDGRKRTD
jgi:hypothetical protein